MIFLKSISIAANSLLNNVKDKKLKKVFDTCKVIHALKQPKNLLRLLSKPKVQNCISENHGFLPNPSNSSNFLPAKISSPKVLFVIKLYTRSDIFKKYLHCS